MLKKSYRTKPDESTKGKGARIMEKRNEELLYEEMEAARARLNASIDRRDAYDLIYRYSVEMDRLLNRYCAEVRSC